MSKKNVLIFRGIDTFSLEESLKKWIDVFTEKYGTHNISHIDGDDSRTNWKSLESEIVSGGFLAEKRLFVIRNYTIKLRKSEEIESSENEEIPNQQKETSLLTMIESIPEDNFLIIVNPSIPRTKKISKLLETSGTLKEFNTPYQLEGWMRRFPELDDRVIARVLQIYQSRDNPKEPRPVSLDIHTSLEHIFLFTETNEKYRVEDFISIEKEAVIFHFLDYIYARKIPEARNLFHQLLLDNNIYALVGSVLTNLRKTLYIKALAKRQNQRSIEEKTKSVSFTVDKSLHTAVSFDELLKFFSKIIEANTSQKTGKGMYDSELGLIFSIELGLLSLQK